MSFVNISVFGIGVGDLFSLTGVWVVGCTVHSWLKKKNNPLAARRNWVQGISWKFRMKWFEIHLVLLPQIRSSSLWDLTRAECNLSCRNVWWGQNILFMFLPRCYGFSLPSKQHPVLLILSLWVNVNSFLCESTGTVFFRYWFVSILLIFYCLVKIRTSNQSIASTHFCWMIFLF